MSRWLPLIGRIFGAAFSGLMVFASFQPTGLWWAAPLAFTLFFAVVTERHAVLLSFVQTLVTYLFLLPWIGEFVGASAWIALAIVQSLYALIFGLGLRFILRWRGKAPLAILIAALFFVAVEWFRSSWPFGGFGWGRIAWGQVGGPLGFDIRLGGAAFVSFLIVAVGGTLYLVLANKNVRIKIGSAAVVVGVLLGSAGYGHTMHNDGGEEEPTINVAAIQGNVPRAGLDFAAQRRAVLSNHVRRTHELAEKVARGEADKPDVVVWPENSSDVNPFHDQFARESIQGAVDAIDAPTLVGTVVGDSNTMLTWNPTTAEQPGPGQRHIKKFLQPFGEYMPFRDILKHVNENVERAGNFQPGNGTGVVTMGEDGRSTHVGVSTCYEISFDASPREAVNNGAEILTSPTNNATFGFTDMSYQQLAMSRMRAIETDRAVVVAATSGMSAIVKPNGEVVNQSRLFTPDILQAELPLRTTLTPSVRAGAWPERILASLGVIGAIAAFLASRQPSGRKKQKR